MKNANAYFLFLVALSFGLGFLAYPHLPDLVASHWNGQGVADEYMPKFWGIFLFPFIMCILYALYIAIPSLDPLKKNIVSFQKQYDMFWLSIGGFFLYIMVLSLAWNFGHRFNFGVFMLPALAVLFFFIGDLMEHTKRNWFVGIRTPWTLSSDAVWDATNKHAGKLFKLAALGPIIAMVFPSPLSIFIAVTPVVIVAFWSTIFSYLEFKRYHKRS